MKLQKYVILKRKSDIVWRVYTKGGRFTTFFWATNFVQVAIHRSTILETPKEFHADCFIEDFKIKFDPLTYKSFSKIELYSYLKRSAFKHRLKDNQIKLKTNEKWASYAQKTALFVLFS